MKLKIYKYPEGKDTKIGHICIKKEFADLWYNEISKRWSELRNGNEEVKIFDIDETYEFGQISLGHLEEMIKFLKNETNNKR